MASKFILFCFNKCHLNKSYRISQHYFQLNCLFSFKKTPHCIYTVFCKSHLSFESNSEDFKSLQNASEVLEDAQHHQTDNYSEHPCLLTSQNATEICHCLLVLLSPLSLMKEDNRKREFWVKTLTQIIVGTIAV